MSYATLASLLERYGEEELVRLTDVAGRGVVDTERVTRALDDADAAIDVYLASRYTLPLANPPVVLSRLAATLVRYWLHGDSAPERARKEYEDALRLLERIASGAVDLGVVSDSASSADVQMVTGRKDFAGGAY